MPSQYFIGEGRNIILTATALQSLILYLELIHFLLLEVFFASYSIDLYAIRECTP